MYRRKVTVAAVALFAIGVAFAAQPTSLRADWGQRRPKQGMPWVPGTNALMPADEPIARMSSPPR